MRRKLFFFLIISGSWSAAEAQAGRSTSAAQSARTAAVRTIEAKSVAAKLVQGPQCRAYAPVGWRSVGGRQTGDAFDLASNDGRMYAGWGMRGVNRSMEMYGPLHSDPETSSLALAAAVFQSMGSSTPQYSAAPMQLGDGFVAREFASATHKGILVFRLYPPPPGYARGSYIISLRIAAAVKSLWDADGQRVAVGVAASINCSTMLQAPRGNDIDLPRPGDPPGMKRRSGETDDLADYNAQLGTQWVRSESTGERFLVDHATTWNETGPDGPGYYRKSGNSVEKLTPGFGG